MNEGYKVKSDDDIQEEALREWNKIHKRKVYFLKKLKKLRKAAKIKDKIKYTWWIVKIRFKYIYY